MWELDYKESWVPKNWRFWTVSLEKTLESPLDSNEIQPVHPKGDQFWVFFWETDVGAKTLIFWLSDAKSWLIWKDSESGKDWAQEEKRRTEDEMAGWHHRLDGRESEWTPGVDDGQGGLACCVAKSRTRLSDWTELNTVYVSDIQTLWFYICLHCEMITTVTFLPSPHPGTVFSFVIRTIKIYFFSNFR